jgi:molybdopterin converting factor small subunit
MNKQQINQYIAENIFTEGPTISSTEIVVNETNIFIKPENYSLKENDRIYIFSQNNGAVNLNQKD